VTAGTAGGGNASDWGQVAKGFLVVWGKRMRANARLLEQIFLCDPYSGFNFEAWSPDLQGWGFAHPILTQAIDLLRPRTIIEVGTWRGASAIRMARHMKAEGIDGAIICVDTWLGAIEHFLARHDTNGFPALKMKHGFPQIFYQFLANVIHFGVQDVIVPLPQTSHIGARILSALGIHAGLVYIDGSHEFNDVYLDLHYY
jgi:hypothetical protein